MRAAWSCRDLVALAGLLAFYASAVTVMARSLDETQWGALDAELYHLPQTNWFIEWGISWNYPAWSATGPGFHWVMAAVANWTGAEALDQGSWQSHVVPAVLTGLALIFYFGAMRFSGASPERAFIVGAPMVSSSYFWTPALHPVSESLSILGFFAMACMIAGRPPPSLGFGVSAAVATIARQNFLSASGALALMAFVQDWPRVLTLRMAAIVVASVGPALIVMAILYANWGGLTPKEWQEMHVGPSLGPILHGIMLLGVFGWLFLRPEDFEATARARMVVLALVILCAGTIWLLVPENGGERPYSMIWKFVRMFPEIDGRPILNFPLLVLGMLTLAAYWWRGYRDGFRLSPELSLFACYFLAQALQAFSWQRYAEVPVLLVLCTGSARLRRPSLVPDLAMLAVFGAYFLLSVRRMADVF